MILSNEPLSRGNGGKPHWAEFCYRVGGEAVYVCDQHPARLTVAAYNELLKSLPKTKLDGSTVAASVTAGRSRPGSRGGSGRRGRRPGRRRGGGRIYAPKG